MLNYCDESFSDLDIYVSEVVSALAKFWTCSQRARPSIMVPGGRDLEGF